MVLPVSIPTTKKFKNRRKKIIKKISKIFLVSLQKIMHNMNKVYQMLTQADNIINKVLLIGEAVEQLKAQYIEEVTGQQLMVQLSDGDYDEPDDFIQKNFDYLDFLNLTIALTLAILDSSQYIQDYIGNSDNPNMYAEGGLIDTLYEDYRKTLPRNLRNEDPDFNMYRYWELNGKPKNFKQARERGMFTWNNEDKSYHAGSVAYDLANDRYEFVKSPNHLSIDMELLLYFNSDEMSNFRRDWKLNMDHTPYLYERRKLGDTSLFANGGKVNRYDNAGQVATGNVNPNFNLLKLPTFLDFNNPNEQITLNNDYETVTHIPEVTVLPDLNLRNRILTAYPEKAVRNKILTALNNAYETNWNNGIEIEKPNGEKVNYNALYSPNLGIERLLNIHALSNSPWIRNARTDNKLEKAWLKTRNMLSTADETVYPYLPNNEYYRAHTYNFLRPTIYVDYELHSDDFLNNLVSEYSHQILNKNFPNYFDIQHNILAKIINPDKYNKIAYNTPGELERYTHSVVEPYLRTKIYYPLTEIGKLLETDIQQNRDLLESYNSQLLNSIDLKELGNILNEDIINNPPDEKEYSDFWKKYYKLNPNSSIGGGAGGQW